MRTLSPKDRRLSAMAAVQVDRDIRLERGDTHYPYATNRALSAIHEALASETGE